MRKPTGMAQARRSREATRRVSLRVATAALAVAGLSASTLVVNVAGAASSHRAKHLAISTAQNATLGTILVSGRTLYASNKANCTRRCLNIWLEVLLPKGVTKATAGAGVDASKLGTVKRAGGARQVTYSGRALYWFSGDKAPGQVLGNVTDKWGTWSVVVTAPLPATPTSTASSTPAIPTPSPTAATSPAPTTSPPPPPTTTVPKAPTTTTTAPGSGGVSF
jgi:predicted lipoprotein with Yx(FWY)xxD motif